MRDIKDFSIMTYTIDAKYIFPVIDKSHLAAVNFFYDTMEFHGTSSFSFQMIHVFPCKCTVYDQSSLTRFKTILISSNTDCKKTSVLVNVQGI